jgi:hypothetical protein
MMRKGFLLSSLHHEFTRMDTNERIAKRKNTTTDDTDVRNDEARFTNDEIVFVISV